jgi:nitrogenase molybdenum-cofactor synthesis protein NifE
MSKTLRAIGNILYMSDRANEAYAFLQERIESVIRKEEELLLERLTPYEHMRGRKAVLYTGGVKSWSFISALMDLGIEVVAVGTKKSTFEDEEKMRQILGAKAKLIEDVTPKNLLRLIKDEGADMLIAGGRNQYLAAKEGIPFVDVNQERHTAYAGYEGLVNLAGDISASMRFYSGGAGREFGVCQRKKPKNLASSPIVINPLKHSQALGAAIAFQGIHRAVPVTHGAQGCNFLGKVLLTKHFREPISLISTKLFTEDVVMGSEEGLVRTVRGIIDKNFPDVIGVLTTGLSEVKGDDVTEALKNMTAPGPRVIHVSTPDYEGGLESGYVKAVETLLELAGGAPWQVLADNGAADMSSREVRPPQFINVLAGCHLTPADFTELREIIESFGLQPLILPDLSSLDGSRQGFSPLAEGGIAVRDIKKMDTSLFTLAIGVSMEKAAMSLKARFGVDYRVFEAVAGLEDTDNLMATLSALSGRETPDRYKRLRKMLVDGMRDAHLIYGNKKVCLALEPDLSIQFSKWLGEIGATIPLAVLPTLPSSAERVRASEVRSGDLFSIEGEFDLLISSSHAVDTADRLKTRLYQTGFPVYKIFGNNTRITIGYRGTLATINEIANLFIKEVQ